MLLLLLLPFPPLLFRAFTVPWYSRCAGKGAHATDGGDRWAWGIITDFLPSPPLFSQWHSPCHCRTAGHKYSRKHSHSHSCVADTVMPIMMMILLHCIDPCIHFNHNHLYFYCPLPLPSSAQVLLGHFLFVSRSCHTFLDSVVVATVSRTVVYTVFRTSCSLAAARSDNRILLFAAS